MRKSWRRIKAINKLWPASIRFFMGRPTLVTLAITPLKWTKAMSNQLSWELKKVFKSTKRIYFNSAVQEEWPKCNILRPPFNYDIRFYHFILFGIFGIVIYNINTRSFMFPTSAFFTLMMSQPFVGIFLLVLTPKILVGLFHRVIFVIFIVCQVNFRSKILYARYLLLLNFILVVVQLETLDSPKYFLFLPYLLLLFILFYFFYLLKIIKILSFWWALTVFILIFIKNRCRILSILFIFVVLCENRLCYYCGWGLLWFTLLREIAFMRFEGVGFRGEHFMPRV